MVQRTNDGYFVGQIGQPREMLADLDVADPGRNRLEQPPDFGRRLGFHVERVELAGSAPHEQENAALGLAETRTMAGRGRGCPSGGPELRQTEPQGPERSGLEYLASAVEVADGIPQIGTALLVEVSRGRIAGLRHRFVSVESVGYVRRANVSAWVDVL